MGRIEYKYLVPKKILPDIRKYCEPYLELDNYAASQEKKEYLVRSIYYDSPKYDFYFEKVEGLRKRKKVRIRGYNEYSENAKVFLEIKRKNGPTISKTRSPVLYKNFPVLLETGDIKTYVSEFNGHGGNLENARRFLFHVKNLALNPVILINYDREAFFYKFNRDLRITFDKNLRSKIHSSVNSIFDNSGFVNVLTDYFILEIKTTLNFPSWLNYLLANFELRQQALSKYTMCLDSHKMYGFQMKGISSSRISVGSKLDLSKMETR
jgi:hypothetical protein